MKQFLVKTLVLIFGLLLSGCVSQHAIENDISRTNEQAYHDWQSDYASRDSLTGDSSRVQPKSYEEPSNKVPLISGKLNLQDAMKLALIYNRNLRKAVAEKVYANGQILSSYGNVAPTADVSGTYTRKNEVNTFNFGGNKFQSGFLNNYSVTLSIEQPIINARGILGLRASQLYRTLTDKQIQTATENTLYQVEQQYYHVLMLQKQYQVRQENVKYSQASLNDVQNKVKYGTATHFNLIRAQVDLSNAKTQEIQAKNDLEQAKATFFNTLGVSQNSQVALDDSLDYESINTNQGKAIQTALQNRPDLASSKLNVELQKSSLKSMYARYLPTVSAYFDQTWANPAPLTVPPTQSWGYLWNAGLRLNWSIFNLDREGSIQQERSTLRQQKLTYLDTQQQVIYDVHSAVMALQNAEQSVEAQKLTVQQANEGLKLAQAQFKQGTIDQVSLLEARQALSEAQLSYYSSLFQHKVARLDLLKATGQLKMKFSKDKSDSLK